MIRSKLQCLHRGCDTSIAGQYDYDDRRIVRLDVLDQVQSVDPRHLQIEQHKIGTQVARKLHGLGCRVSGMGFATAISKCAAESIAKRLIVVDYENDRRITDRVL